MTETIVDFNMQIYSKLGNQGDYIKFLAKTFDNVGDALNEMRVSHQIETQLQSQGAVEDEEDSVTREQRALLSIANANWEHVTTTSTLKLKTSISLTHPHLRISLTDKLTA
jgi:hypothetical protein